MFKSENDSASGKLGLADPLALPVNANSTAMQFVINTDATAGTLTFSITSRKSIQPEQLFRSDGVTQVIVDLSTTERTVPFDEGFAIKEISALPAGLNGTYYEVIASSGEL
jgi:hypothetical protein